MIKDMTIAEFVESRLGTSNLLKVKKKEFETATNTFLVTYIYNYDYKDFVSRNANRIESLTNDFVQRMIEGENIKLYVKVEYKRSYTDENLVSIAIKKYINEHGLDGIDTDRDEIIVKKEDDTFIITINAMLDDSYAIFYNTYFDKFIADSEKDYFYKFKVNVNFLGTDEVEEEIEEEEIEEDDYEYDDGLIEVKDIRYYIGRTSNTRALRVSDLDEKMVSLNLAICGTCNSFEKVKMKKKSENENTKDTTIGNSKVKPQQQNSDNTETPKDDEKDKYYYSFMLKYGGETIKCVYFLPRQKKGQDEIKENVDFSVQNGEKVIVEGVLQDYRGSLSLSVKALSLCDFEEENLAKIQFLPIPKNYTTVFPEKFIDERQADIFDIFEPKEVKEEVKNMRCVVFDLETTGFDPDEEKIIEISAIKIIAGEMIESFNTFLNPEKPISKDITKLTRITDDMVKDAPKDYQVIGDFMKFCEGCKLVAYNAPFDMGFLKKLAIKCRYYIDNPVEDVLVLARNKLDNVGNFALKTVAKKLDINFVGSHRAINDTLATAKVYLKLLEKY